MAITSEFSVGLMHELAVAGCEVGWEPKDFDALKRNKGLLIAVLQVIHNPHLIACLHPINFVVDPLTELEQLVEKWKEQKARLTKLGFTEADREWQLMKNRYENDVNHIQDL